MIHLVCRLLFVSMMLVMPIQSFAQNYALLVGVSAYPEGVPQLNGPKNDVVLAKTMLKNPAFGFSDENIRMLANGVKEANGEPTRRNILGELDALAKKVKPGDYVYFQFGGHGSQQPTHPGKIPREADGLDEIILPSDIGRWDSPIQAIDNAIRDDEVGASLDAIRAQGAFVWAVFDACHSGNITRGAQDPETSYRAADPVESLGVPQKAMDKAQADALRDAMQSPVAPAPKVATPDSAKESLKGDYVYFYAAQTTEQTPESRFAPGDPDRKSYGVFTYTLSQVVLANPGISYRQAGERVLQIYASRNLNVTPMWEGSAIDAPVFGQKVGDTLRQWRVESGQARMEIKAGSLQQFATGAIFGVYKDAAAKRDVAPLGYLTAAKVEVMRTELVPVEYNGKPALATLPGEAVVRLVNPNVNLTLTVALPPSVPQGKEYMLAKKVIDNLRNVGSDGIKVEWVKSDKPADVRLMLSDDRKQLKDTPQGSAQLWLVPSDGAWMKTGEGKTPSIRLDKTEADLLSVLSSELQSIAKATNLYRLANVVGGGLADTSKVETHFYITHVQSGKREEMTGDKIPELQKGDRLQISVTSKNKKDMDISVLGIDARYGVNLLYPDSATDANRLHARDSVTIPGEGQGEIALDGNTVGRESILIIAVEAEPDSPVVNLGFLQQPSLAATRGVRGIKTAADDLFESAGFGGGEGGIRGFAKQGVAAEKTTIKMYQYKAQGEVK